MEMAGWVVEVVVMEKGATARVKVEVERAAAEVEMAVVVVATAAATVEGVTTEVMVVDSTRPRLSS